MIDIGVVGRRELAIARIHAIIGISKVAYTVELTTQSLMPRIK
jgi:hypothetical protein